MHGNRFISALMRLSLSAMVAAAVSCRKEALPEESRPDSSPSLNATAKVTVEFNILDPDSLPATKTDTPTGWSSHDGSNAEKKINNIHLFAVDYDAATGEESVEEVIKVDLVPGDFTATGVRTGHTFNLTSGTKRFYVGANMTEAHVQAFCNKTAMRADSYESALAMVMDNYESKTGEGTNILMFSSPATDISDKTEVEISGSRFINLSAQLKRLVSKVMVNARYTGNKVNADGRSDETIPYIETAGGFFFDFQFILNNTNRALNISEKFEDTNDLFNTDPNWTLSSVMEKDGTGTIRYKSMWNLNENFSHWGDIDIQSRLEKTSDWWCSSVPSNAVEGNYLGKGLYCLENTVFDDYSLELALTSEEKTEAAYLATTHVYIKARFAPKTINGDSDNSTNTTNDRISHLYWQKDAAGNNPYTFYVHKTTGAFFTFTGVRRWIDNSRATSGDFEEYTGGWVYFRTFFEEGGQDEDDGIITYDGIEYWGIRRNDYCILTINSIENWGDTSPGEAFIKVKSETVPWVKAGKSDITVTPE